MDIKKEDLERLEDAAANVDRELEDIQKDPKSVKAWVKVVAACITLGGIVVAILAGLGLF